jgi:hypothetical protein
LSRSAITRNRSASAYNGYHSDNGSRYLARDNGNGYHGPRGTSRSYVLARLARAGCTDLAAQVEAGRLSVRAALAALKAAGATRKNEVALRKVAGVRS